MSKHNVGTSLGQQSAPQSTTSATGYTLGGTTLQNTSFQATKSTTAASSGFSLSQPSGAGGLTSGSSPAMPTTTISATVGFNTANTAAVSSVLSQATTGGGLVLGQAAATSGGPTLGWSWINSA